MDCEQFDQIVLDVLYGELSDGEELAAARRHLDRCERCSGLLSGLRSARQAAALPRVAPPAAVRDRVMLAARAAQHEVPWSSRLGRWVSVAGSYAMRPQLAMAALLLLMIGSSLLLLRGRPGTGQLDVVHVTEQGVPERDQVDNSPTAVPERLEPRAGMEMPAPARGESSGASAHPADSETGAARDARRTAKAADSLAQPADGVPTTADDSADRDRPNDESQRALANADGARAQQNYGNVGPGAQEAPAAAPPADDYAAAMAMFQAGDFANAYRAFDNVAARGGANASSASLYAAKAVRNSAGCSAALPRFESVMARAGAANAGIQARWEAATCARILGDYPRARQYYGELAAIESQRERAEAELARLSPSRNQNQNAQRAPAAAPSNRAAEQRPAKRNQADRSNAY